MTASSAVRSGPDLRRLPLRHLALAAVLPLILLGLLGTALLARGTGSSTAIGKLAPSFSLTALDGSPLHLADLRGRPVIVNFWASWCVPCVEEFPILRDAAAAHADDGLVIVGIVYRDRTEAARRFMADNGGTWTAAMDPDERVAQAYQVAGPPETYFIGRDGTIVARHFGQFTASSLEAKIAAIMGGE
jgi:cytochrome c biogenesis protein CcmG, thiol:disulfide interchange protein DsbE